MCLQTYSAPAASTPFQAHDQNPFKRIHGLPAATAASLPAENVTAWSVGLDISNTLNVENTGQEILFVDFEAYQLNLGMIHSLNKTWALKIDVPFIHLGGGFLDHTIDEWHQIFGLPRALRPLVAEDQFQILYTNNGADEINLAEATGGLGDIQIALGKRVFESKQANVSVWASLELPSGDQSRLTGNDKVDLAFWLAGDYGINPQWSINTNIGALLPGANALNTAAVEDTIGFGHFGIQWTPQPMFKLKLQLNGHSRFYRDSELRFLGSSNSVIFGGSIRVGACSMLDLAVSEDIKVGASPDVSFDISWRSQWGKCSQPAQR